MASFSRVSSSLSEDSTLTPGLMTDHRSQSTRRLNSTIRAPSKYKSGDKLLTLRRLDIWYKTVKNQVLQYQSFTTGLYPRLSNNEQVAYIRDSLYCSMACWALSLAYSMDDDRGRQYELGQSVVKTMRGVLFSWMRQADKIEKFKKDHSPRNALHSKFHLITGEPIVGDEAYGHLQIDVVALFLLCLVQMITAGLEIIFTTDEVSFVQNLVFYVERAYRTPDFGMWEDGTRYNDGTPELHASSVGTVKAVLEAINGFNCYGSKGTTASVIYVDIDAHNRNRTIFESLLPRESASKNTDVSLMPTISFPCFATHDPKIYHRTMEKCVRRLRGSFGFKRFLRDGHFSAIEDTSRRFYKAGETKLFDGIECQWPMFYLYMIIDACFSEKNEQRQKYWDLLHACLVEGEDGAIIVPQYYFLPEECVFQERCNPGSQTMSPSTELNDGLFLWGQSLYIIASLLSEQLILPTELDPIYRHLPASQRPKINTRHSVFQSDHHECSDGVEYGGLTDTVVQVALIAESVSLQAKLLTYGIQAQTPHQVEPVQIWPPGQLVKVFEKLGKNDRLKLCGRPPRPIGALGTSKIYRVFGDTVMCYPLLFEISDFYMSYDPAVIIDDIKKDLKFIARRWKLCGRPTFCFLLRDDNVSAEYFSQMLDLLVGIKNGYIDGIRVRLGRVQNLLAAACVEHLDFASVDNINYTIKPLKEVESETQLLDFVPAMSNAVCDISVDSDFSIDLHRNKSTPELIQLLKTTLPTSLYTQSRILHLLKERHGLDLKLDGSLNSVQQMFNKLCRQAALVKNWSVVRYCAASLRKTVDSLAPSVTSILVRGKRLTVGVFGHEEITIDKPVTPDEIADYLYRTCSPYDLSLAVLEQEILIALGYYTTVEPQLFSSILKIRIGWFIHAMTLLLNYENDKSVVSLTMLSPTEVKQVLRDILTMKRFNRLSNLQQRQLNGSLNRVPPDFYERLWKVMEKTPEGIIVVDHHLPQQPTLSDMTEYELNFAFAIDALLSRINQPEYRQLMVEAFMVVSLILERNPELHFVTALNMDNIISEAFSIYCKEKSIVDQTDMAQFYHLQWQGRLGTGAYLARAVVNVLLKHNDNTLPFGNLEYPNTQCSIS